VTVLIVIVIRIYIRNSVSVPLPPNIGATNVNPGFGDRDVEMAAQAGKILYFC
jgi:hypothetical protein